MKRHASDVSETAEDISHEKPVSSDHESFPPSPSHLKSLKDDISDISGDILQYRDTLRAYLSLDDNTQQSQTDFRANTLEFLEETLPKLNGVIENVNIVKPFLETVRNRRDSGESVRLNLRGVIFEANRDALLRPLNTYFHGMLSSVFQDPENGVPYLIDRPPDGFQRILEYLRSGELSYADLNEYETSCIDRNLDYFRIPIPTKRWDYSTSKNIPGEFYSVAIQLPDGNICSAAKDNSIKVWDLSRGAVVLSLEGHANEVTALVCLIDRRLCSSSWDDTIRVWNLKTGSCERYFHCEYTVLAMVEIEGSYLHAGDSLGFIRLWNLTSGTVERVDVAHYVDPSEMEEDEEEDSFDCCIRALIRLQDGRLCSGSADHSVRIWGTTGTCEVTFTDHRGGVNSVIQLQDGQICSGADDRTLMIWSPINGEVLMTIGGSGKGILSVIQLHDGRICCGTWEGKLIRLYSAETGECVKVLAGLICDVMSVLQLRDGRLCGIADHQQLRIWY